MKNLRNVFFCLALCTTIFAGNGYRIEISNQAVADVPVFLAAYYGNRIFVVDSTMFDAAGVAVFQRDYLLCAGMYTVVAPGKLQFDFLIDTQQVFRAEWTSSGELLIEGDELLTAWVAYQENKADREQLIAQFPGTLLSAYLTALRPAESPNISSNAEIFGDITQMFAEYHRRRQNFFVNMPLSDVRLLRTPIFHENINYFITQFVTQQPDSLIHIAYGMLEQAAGNSETFFFVSDFMIEYSLRNINVENINRLYNFITRNRDMLGARGASIVPTRSRANYFTIHDESSLTNMNFSDINGQTFDFKSIGGKYHVYYFWRNNCTRCIADASRWLAVINRFQNRSLKGIAVNIENDVQHLENRIMAYEPLCTNVSAVNMPSCRTVFFATNYSKILLTDAQGNIIGLFASPVLLESFLENVILP